MHKSERLEFASIHCESNFDFWVYADETRCESHHVKSYRMRKPERRPKAVGIYKRDRFKVNVWGAVCSRGAVKFVVIFFNLRIIYILPFNKLFIKKIFKHNMYATTYQHIIKNHLAPFIKQKYNNENCFLIQDNDGKHTADICIDELNKHNIKWVIFLPPE